jgi:hypothetical protein
MMSKSRTFENVTAEIFACIKETTWSKHGAIYEPANALSGTVKTTVPLVGTVVLGFEFDPDAETIIYSIVKKPFVVAEHYIWDGIQETIDTCGAVG